MTLMTKNGPTTSEASDGSTRYGILPADLRRLKLDNPRIVEVGFIFIWVEKQHIAEVLDVFEEWQFKYVENIKWVRYAAHHRLMVQPYRFFNASKLTLLLARKMTDKRVEIRHQRTPDVIFDFVRYEPGGGREQKPFAVYEMIEILLPYACCGRPGAAATAATAAATIAPPRQAADENGSSPSHHEESDESEDMGKQQQTTKTSSAVVTAGSSDHSTSGPMTIETTTTTPAATAAASSGAARVGKLLHLWSARNYRRPGWTHVVEV